MDKLSIVEVLNEIKGYYPIAKITSDKNEFKVWCNTLKDLDYGIAVKAVMKMGKKKYNSFEITVGTFLEEYKDVEEDEKIDRDNEKWQKERREIEKNAVPAPQKIYDLLKEKYGKEI